MRWWLLICLSGSAGDAQILLIDGHGAVGLVQFDVQHRQPTHKVHIARLIPEHLQKLLLGIRQQPPVLTKNHESAPMDDDSERTAAGSTAPASFSTTIPFTYTYIHEIPNYI